MNTQLPVTLLERIKEIAPADRLDEILTSISKKKLPSFRVNTLRADRNDVITDLHQLGFELEQIPWYTDAFYLKNKSIRELTDTSLYIDGKLYIQSASSMIPAIVLDPQPGEKILDIAAAPGSKTTQIAEIMGNEGEIVANDLSRERKFKLRDNLKQQGVTNTTVSTMPGERLWTRYPEYFDRTLVDVPCSMEGRISTLDPKSYADWSLKRIKSLAVRQQYLLRAAVTATKIGGTIVYSTCTLSPEENESVIDWLLEKESGKIEVEGIYIPNLQLNPGLHEWKKLFSKNIQKTARIWPSSTMEGFYIAKIRKVASTLPVPKLPSKRR